MSKKYDAFISYSHRDSKFVRNLASRLLKHGFTIFYAEEDIKPGAKFATAVWSTPDQVPFASLPMAVAREVLDPPPPPPPAEAPNIFSLGATGVLESAFVRAGFMDVVNDSRQLHFKLESPREYCEWLSEMTPPIRAMLVGRSQDQIDQFWTAVAERAQVFVKKDGTFEIPNTAPIAIGTR